MKILLQLDATHKETLLPNPLSTSNLNLLALPKIRAMLHLLCQNLLLHPLNETDTSRAHKWSLNVCYTLPSLKENFNNSKFAWFSSHWIATMHTPLPVKPLLSQGA